MTCTNLEAIRDKEVRGFMRQVLRMHGGAILTKPNKKLVYMPALSRFPIQIPTSIGDSRGLKNLKAAFRKRGFAAGNK